MTILRGNPDYWRVVLDCLREFHGFGAADAEIRLRDFQAKIPVRELLNDRSLIYHAEPFDIACDLAGTDLDRSQYNRAYLALVDRIFARPDDSSDVTTLIEAEWDARVERRVAAWALTGPESTDTLTQRDLRTLVEVARRSEAIAAMHADVGQRAEALLRAQADATRTQSRVLDETLRVFHSLYRLAQVALIVAVVVSLLALVPVLGLLR